MAHIIIDRRKNSKGKSTVNRQRYFRRVREQVREAVKETIRDGNIQDITTEKNKKVKLRGKKLKQPHFTHNKEGGKQEHVYTGNKKYVKDDRIQRPPKDGGGGGGGEGSRDGQGEDIFEFSLTREEFLDLFFEDLELPDLVKKNIQKTEEWVRRRAGYSVDGSHLNVLKTMMKSKTRRLALRTPKEKAIKKLEEELRLMEESGDVDEDRKKEILAEIKDLKRRWQAVPFLDDVDVRHNLWTNTPIPATQAVMFAIMDVSYSMGDWEKEMAKRFFMLLYLFLFRNYERTDIIFIRHHSIAKEVDEQEFFYSRETGGTVVSTSLELMHDIIKKRYDPRHWNIFACQASDGDNWPQDSIKSVELLKTMMPYIQYYAYVEIDKRGGKDSDLWPFYEKLAKMYEGFAMNVINDVKEIYPVFRKLFEKKQKGQIPAPGKAA